jgi:hypothetical protein
MLAKPQYCLTATGFTTKEFRVLLVHVAAVVDATASRKHKMNTCERLFMLFYFIQHNCSNRVLELMFGLAKTSICSDLVRMGMIVLDIYKTQFGNLWPSREERDLLRSLLSPTLNATGVFGFVDGSKHTAVRSTDPAVNAMQSNAKKGFGPNSLRVVNILGDLIYYEDALSGHSSDLAQYQASALFHHEGGITWDADETIGGDQAYLGASNRNPDSKELLHVVTMHQMNALPDDQARDLARQFNRMFNGERVTVECNIGGGKRGSVAGDRAKMRMSMNTAEGRAK